MTRPAPPRLARWLLQRFAFGPQHESLIGDIVILFSTHRFDMVEKVCSRAVILSAGRLAAEHRMPDDGHSDSLETLFVRVTEQEDYRPVARQILDVMQHA